MVKCQIQRSKKSVFILCTGVCVWVVLGLYILHLSPTTDKPQFFVDRLVRYFSAFLNMLKLFKLVLGIFL